MTSDPLLAIVHHLAAFSVLAILFAEWALLRPGASAAQLRFTARLDLFYGAMAGLVIVAGFARAFLGPKGWAFYAGNPVFWAKIAVFALIGALSVPPTLAMLSWRKRAPQDADVAALRRWLNPQLLLAPAVPVLAALMARGIGY